MESRYLPIWKAFESPVMALDQSHVELFSLLCIFLLTMVAMTVRARFRQLVRHVVQIFSVGVFFFVVYSCLGVFGMIRNAIYGTTLIGTTDTESFFWMSLPLVVFAFSVTTGPYFCGWICPTGTFQELVAWLRRIAWRLISGNRRPPQQLAPSALSAILVSLVLGGFIASVLWLGRLKPFFTEDASLLWGATMLLLVLLVQTRQVGGQRLRALRGLSFFIVAVSAVLKTTIISPVHFAFTNVFDPASALTTLVVVVGSLFISRAWCRFICPWGFLMGCVHRVSRLQLRTDTKHCNQCGLCDRACGTGAMRLGQVETSSCQFCLACVDSCPNKAIKVTDAWAQSERTRSGARDVARGTGAGGRKCDSV